MEPVKESSNVPTATGDTTHVQPTQTEQVKVESANVEPAIVDSVQTQPTQVEPTNVETSSVEPAKVEAVQAQPIQTEPAKVEAVKTQPTEMESPKTESANVEPAKSEGSQDEQEIQPNRGETDRKRLQEMELEMEALNKKAVDEAPKKSSKALSQEAKTEFEENSKLRDMVANLKEMLREKNLTLTRKNLQTEALEIQISALKEVTILSKGMLDIRNVENLQLKEQIDSMQDKITAERERHNMVLKKAERAASINSELQNEYHKQVALFGELKESYEKKLVSLKAEISRLESLQNSSAT